MWKVVGLAGLIGAVAAGATLGARQIQRARRVYVDADVDEIRARLRARYADIEAAGGAGRPTALPDPDRQGPSVASQP